jgi:DNA polymerase III delta subunit
MATPNPEEELSRLQKLIARGLPAVTVVTGSNDHFRAEAMDLLLAAIPKAAELRLVDAVEVRVAGGGGAGADAETAADDDASDAAAEGEGLAACPELQDLLGGGLFARTAFVVVRRGSGWWQQHVATVAAVLPRLHKGSGLVLEAKKLDKRKKVAQTLVKSLTEAGALFEFRDLYDLPYDRSQSPLQGELCKWLVGRSRHLGVALQPDAAWLLVMNVGKTPVELLAELGRLRDQFGADPKRKPLAPTELRGKLTYSFESTPFEFAEAVLGGDRKAAFRSVRAMFERGVRSKDGKAMDTGGLLPFTTSWLYQQLASVWQGRHALDQGASIRDVPALVGVRQFAERYLDHVQKHDLSRLSRGLQALHACQRASRLTGEEPDALLERFLAQWFDGAPIPSLQDLEG